MRQGFLALMFLLTAGMAWGSKPQISIDSFRKVPIDSDGMEPRVYTEIVLDLAIKNNTPKAIESWTAKLTVKDRNGGFLFICRLDGKTIQANGMAQAAFNFKNDPLVANDPYDKLAPTFSYQWWEEIQLSLSDIKIISRDSAPRSIQ